MTRWKHNRWTPSHICECVIDLYFDLDAPPPRVWRFMGVQTRCVEHPMPDDAMPNQHASWGDGNWYDPERLIRSQKWWYRWRARKGAREAVTARAARDGKTFDEILTIMYPVDPEKPELGGILPKGPDTEPTSLPGKGLIPSTVHDDAFKQVWAWTLGDTRRYDGVMTAVREITGDPEAEVENYWFEGFGNRLLHIIHPNFNTSDKGELQSIADLQFGTGKIVVE